MNEMENYSLVKNATGDWGIQGTGNCYEPLQNWWYPNYTNYYHWFYPTIVYETGKVDKAFKILSSLMEKDLINIKDIKQFIEIVRMIELSL